LTAEYIFVCSDYPEITHEHVKKIYDSLSKNKRTAVYGYVPDAPYPEGLKLIIFAFRKLYSPQMQACIDKIGGISPEAKDIFLRQGIKLALFLSI
jgi:hypothetical protein